MITLLLMAKKGLISNFIIAPLMFITFLILRITKVVLWSWFIVFSPLISIPFAILGLGIVKGLLAFYDKGIE